ncbi:MAG: hypothetical protein Q8L34_02925 [Candidatus Woesearchaeota archaeon]|nr:hypothetical protein [Candidatus Woesearchaeota archaeon]
MPIEGTERLGDWGKKIPVNPNAHVTQTNPSSRDGQAVHITTNIPTEPVKVQDRFDAGGNYLGSNFGKR